MTWPGRHYSSSDIMETKDILAALYEQGLIKTWHRDRPEGWTLVSGLWSPFYINLRALPSCPRLFMAVGERLGEMILERCDVDSVMGIAMAGIPIASAVAVQYGIPMLYTRKLQGVKSLEVLREAAVQYGQHSLVEGAMQDGDRVVAIDDLVTRFDSKLIAGEQLAMEADRRGVDVSCGDVAVLVDREQGAADIAAQHGINLHALIPFQSRGIDWLRDAFTDIEYDVISDYLHDSDKYQDDQRRRDIIVSFK